MLIFWGKKENKDERKREIEEIINKRYQNTSENQKINYNYNFNPQEIHSLDYEKFEEEKKKFDKNKFYEKLCNFSEKILGLKPDKETEMELNKHIKFTGLKITPSGVISASVITFFVLIVFNILLVYILKLMIELPAIFTIFLVALAPAIAFYVYNYPKFYANILRMLMGRDLVLAILYIIVYMKSTSNLEGAIRYAAGNVSGKLSKDLKKLLWNVEIGKYTSVQDALLDYMSMWKDYNKEFVEAIELVLESMVDPSPERRNLLLDKAIDLVLEETEERMKKYTRSLETPIEVIHGMGILLPVMGMVVFPLITIFLKDSITFLDYYLIIGYNIILPVIIYAFIYNILQKRPPTYSSVDMSAGKEYSDKLILHFGKKRYYINYTYITLALLITEFTGIWYLWSNYELISGDESYAKLVLSIIAVYMTSLILALHFYLGSFQKQKLREKIKNIESEFGEALFALGNRLYSGAPLESGLQQAYKDIKNLSISELFAITINNITRLNMTFKQALTDANYGALKRFPSRLVKTIMMVLASSIDRGTESTAMSMITISRYLRGLKRTQEKIEDLLGSSLSSMKFNAYVLVPIISGVIVGISKLVLTLLSKISGVFGNIQASVENTDTAQIGAMNPGSMLGFENAIPTYTIQMIIGFYVIEILIILAMFMTRVEVGKDIVKERENTWKLLVIGTTLYIVVFIITMILFTPLISSISNSFS